MPAGGHAPAGKLAHRGLHLVLGAGAQPDVRALLGQKLHDGPADALGGAGDDRPLPPQTQVHHRPFEARAGARSVNADSSQWIEL